jgi:hypothetical protein
MTAFTKFCSAAILTAALATHTSSASAAQRAADGQAPAAKAGARQLTQSCGKLPLTEVVVNSKPQSTASKSFIEVEGSNVLFDVGGSAKSCVMVSFTAQVAAPDPLNLMLVRAVLDGVPSIDGEIQLVAETDNFTEARAYSFLFPLVAPGSHSFEMQYSTPNGPTVFINDFNMDIRHR